MIYTFPSYEMAVSANVACWNFHWGDYLPCRMLGKSSLPLFFF